MEILRIGDIQLPESFVALCNQYAMVTLHQAMELIEHFIRNPKELPTFLSTEQLHDIQQRIGLHLPAEIQHQQGSRPQSMYGLILDAPDGREIDGRFGLQDHLNGLNGDQDTMHGAEKNTVLPAGNMEQEGLLEETPVEAFEGPVEETSKNVPEKTEEVSDEN